MIDQLQQGDKSTLNLPRILCLHGGGTNARIFRMQCRVLEGSLRSTFRLVYAQAPFPAQPGSDVTLVYQKHGPFKAWLQSTPNDLERRAEEIVAQIDTALTVAMYADDQRGAMGDWVGLLGFSQGARIAASILHTQQLRRQRSWQETGSWPDFRFALLLAGRGPLVWLAPEMAIPRGLVDAACPSKLADDPFFDEDSDEHLLRMPTIHVHGLKDPGLELHRSLLERYCDSDHATVLEWDGEHRVPIKSKDVSAIVEKIYSMAQETGVLSRSEISGRCVRHVLSM